MNAARLFQPPSRPCTRLLQPLQDAGVLISRKAHGAHHKAPFEGNYCIVSGWWNPILDGDGSGERLLLVLARRAGGWAVQAAHVTCTQTR